MNICDEKRNCCIAQTELYASVAKSPSEMLACLQNMGKNNVWRGFPAESGWQASPRLVDGNQAFRCNGAFSASVSKSRLSDKCARDSLFACFPSATRICCCNCWAMARCRLFASAGVVAAGLPSAPDSPPPPPHAAESPGQPSRDHSQSAGQYRPTSSLAPIRD